MISLARSGGGRGAGAPRTAGLAPRTQKCAPLAVRTAGLYGQPTVSESSHFRAVRPVRTPAAYIGGKRNLAARIVDRIERIPHAAYYEPFVGLGGVFLKRRSAPKAEAINDLSRDVATLFRILQRHLAAFLDTIRWQLTTRADFERLVATDPATLTDLERSARFLFLQRTTYAGKVKGRSFGVSPGLSARFDTTKLGPILEEVHSRLAGVVIECLPWDQFITRYDRPGALFFLDPPYWGSEGYYGEELFSRSEYDRMADVLRGLQGRFLLSLNDTKGVRDVFKGFQFEGLETTWSAAGGGGKKVREVLISGPRAAKC